jgi:hypothetical protein
VCVCVSGDHVYHVSFIMLVAAPMVPFPRPHALPPSRLLCSSLHPSIHPGIRHHRPSSSSARPLAKLNTNTTSSQPVLPPLVFNTNRPLPSLRGSRPHPTAPHLTTPSPPNSPRTKHPTRTTTPLHPTCCTPITAPPRSAAVVEIPGDAMLTVRTAQEPERTTDQTNCPGAFGSTQTRR